MKRFFVLSLWTCLCAVHVLAVDLTHCQIVVPDGQPALAGRMARVLSEDVERVTGVRPVVVRVDGGRGHRVVLRVGGLDGRERYDIRTEGTRLTITGSDPRGLAYGVLHVSERIGVSPWYWWADVPVVKRQKLDYKENVTSKEPSVRYRGFFINDEDWGLKTWAAENFERDLQDIGPRTYDKVCELILRLKGNMLAPAMHSCTGAFYSHPESQRAAAAWGIMITTSHCEPLLLNNAARSEWDKERDGEWNYLTNRDKIWQKFDDRLRETAQYDNIYTVGMRGLHDE